jgi:hypothetical protein
MDYCDKQEDMSHANVPNRPRFRAASRVSLFPQFNSANRKLISNPQSKEIQRSSGTYSYKGSGHARASWDYAVQRIFSSSHWGEPVSY